MYTRLGTMAKAEEIIHDMQPISVDDFYRELRPYCADEREYISTVNSLLNSKRYERVDGFFREK